MGAQRYTISDTNPNEACGGGGCACSELKNEDAKGPFVVFFGTETASNVSPHTVVCVGCINGASEALDPESATEILSAGEPDVVDVEHAEVPNLMDALKDSLAHIELPAANESDQLIL